YANARNKASKVRDVVDTTIALADKEIREISEEISDEQKELDRLRQTTQAHAKTDTLDADIRSLRRKLADAGIAVASEQPDAADVRGWRAALEGRHAESESRSARLGELAKEAAGLPAALAELTTAREQLAERERALSAVDEKRRVAELEAQRAEQ